MFLPIPLHERQCCVILQAMDHAVLKEMEKALGENKTLEMVTLSDDANLPKEFCRHLMIGIGRSTSLSKLNLSLFPHNWDCPIDGRLVYVSYMLCDSVGCGV